MFLASTWNLLTNTPTGHLKWFSWVCLVFWFILCGIFVSAHNNLPPLFREKIFVTGHHFSCQLCLWSNWVFANMAEIISRNNYRKKSVVITVIKLKIIGLFIESIIGLFIESIIGLYWIWNDKLLKSHYLSLLDKLLKLNLS